MQLNAGRHRNVTNPAMGRRTRLTDDDSRDHEGIAIEAKAFASNQFFRRQMSVRTCQWRHHH